MAAPVRLLHERILSWYAANARVLPWRDGRTSPWGVLVSEVMLQQTPVARVEPVWRTWMERWSTPTALAAESPGEVVRAWGRLGYPRRALRLHQAASVIVSEYHGDLPSEQSALRELPGIGEYTAAAVAAFGFGADAVVVDTNVRRVLARVVGGEAQAAPALTRAEWRRAADAVPADRQESVTWNVAVMELGALICTARTPRCPQCPVRDLCAWSIAGSPAYAGPPRRGQAWAGTDRQVRGAVLGALRHAEGPLHRAAIDAALDALSPMPGIRQRDRAVSSLIEDGLVEVSRRGGEQLLGLPL